ncbi:hypothetical protein EF405_04115 [Cyclobacteriaceae bacterium YHN15]|nr:hypothetical protein EF405_04115 [Cyclobacteriaceae bacterium YHN15]
MQSYLMTKMKKGLLPDTKSGNIPFRIEKLIINYLWLKLILSISHWNHLVSGQLELDEQFHLSL